MRATLPWLILGLLFVSGAEASTYYISPTGDNGDSGVTAALAWKDWDYALGVTSGFSPGDTLVADGGTWSGADCPCQDAVTQGGTSTALPTVVIGNGSTIDAASQIYADCSSIMFDLQSGNMIWRGLTIRDTPPAVSGEAQSSEAFTASTDLGRFELRAVHTERAANDSVGGLFELPSAYSATTLVIDGCNTAHAHGRTIEISGFAPDARMTNITFERYVIGSRNHVQLDGSGSSETLPGLLLEGCVFELGGISANLKASRATIRRCQFIGALDEGLRIDGDDIHVRGNLFRENRAYGLHISDGYRALVEHNTFYRNADRFDGTQIVAPITLGSQVDGGVVVRSNWFYKLNNHGNNGSLPSGGEVLVLTNVGSAAIAQWDYNYYWDPGIGPGKNQVDGWVIDFAFWEWSEWQGTKGFDVNGVYASTEPTFIDSLTNNWILSDGTDSGVRGAHDGASIGANPAASSFVWEIGAASATVDSLHFEATHPDLTKFPLLLDSAVFKYGDTFMAETALDTGATANTYRGEWRVWRPNQATYTDRYDLPASGIIDSIRAVGVTWLADSVRVDLSNGSHVGTLQFQESVASNALGYVRYVVRQGAAGAGPIIQKKVSEPDGIDDFAYNVNESYWIRAWVPGAYALFTDNWKPLTGGIDKVFQLDPLPSNPPALASQVNMDFFTGSHYAGALIDSMEVSTKPLGRRPRAGAVFLVEQWTSHGLTDENGRVEFDLYRSSAIEASGTADDLKRLHYQLRATDTRSPQLYPAIEIAEFTAPDSTNAGVVFNIP